MRFMKQRGGLPEKERRLRSQIHQLLSNAEGLLHGSLIQMARKCGNPRCKCETQNEKHVSLYLGQTQKRKTKMQYIPKHLEETVTQWVKNYDQVKSALDQISDERWKSIPLQIKQKTK